MYLEREGLRLPTKQRESRDLLTILNNEADTELTLH